MNKPILFLLVYSLLSQGISIAEESVSVGFNVMLWAPFQSLQPGVPAPKEPELWFSNGGKPEVIPARWNTPSSPQRYTGPTTMQFYRSHGETDGQPSLRPLLSVTIPEPAKHLLFIFFQNKDGSHSVFPIDVGLQNMPKGSLKLINYSGEELAAKVGESSQSLKNRGEWIIPVAEASDFQLRIQLAAMVKKKWRLIYRSGFAVSDDSRMVFLIHKKDFTSGPFRVRPIAGFGTVDDTMVAPDYEEMAKELEAQTSE